MKKRKARILVLFLAVLLVSVSACKNPFLKKMLVEEEKGESSAVPKHTVTFSVEGGHGTLKVKADGIAETDVSPITVEQGKKVTFTAEPAAPYVVKEWKVDGTVVTGNTSNSYTHSVTAAVDVKVSFDAPFVEGGASLILSPNKLVISVKAVTSDGSAVAVEGCTETSLASGSTYTWLHATGTVVILKGKIIKLDCYNNQLTALNIQGLTALQGLNCGDNKLIELNVQGLTALQKLSCYSNQLTALNMQGLTALKELYCYNNQLTALNVQGCTALKGLSCGYNQLTTLNVQGLTALRTLRCYNNKLTAQAFTKLFDDLPARQDSDKGECILYTEESGLSEGNHTDFSTPEALKTAFNNAKNNKKWKMYKWKMYKWNGSWLGVEI